MQLGHEREAGVLTLYADEAEYFSRIGLEPFRTLARVCEGALVQVRTREALHRKATIDGLTGLINRGAMRVLLARGHALAIRYGRPLSVIMFDLDNLKTLNDVYGHEVGDFMLQGVARAARASMRESDVVSRWGGDEFLCLMPEIDGVAARRVAERLREDVAQVSVRAGAGVVRASISVGMASYPADGSGMHDLLRMADRALYRAKAQGRNTVRMASDAA
jgi:diguanylate cyclase (GGDEF)-like protein